MDKGKYVSRSVYQKVAEENKRLKADIRILTQSGVSAEKILLIKQWREKFKKDKDLNELIREMITMGKMSNL